MLHVISKGDPNSKQVVVLLHGYLSTVGYWRTVQEVLAMDNYVIAIDLLGFGKSAKPENAQYTIEEHVAAVHHTLLGMKIAQAVFIGHSMGAVIALHYARLHSENVQASLLLNIPAYKNAKQAHQHIAGTNVFYRWLLYKRARRIIWPAIRVCLPRNFPHHVGGLALNTAQSRFLSLRNVVERGDVITQLLHTNANTVVIMGTRDRAIYKENLKPITKVPTIWVDSGHHTAQVMPQLVIEQYEALLKKVRLQ